MSSEMDSPEHPDSNEDRPLIEHTPMIITLVMADANIRDPPRIPPPPMSGRSTAQAAIPTGAQAMAQPWTGQTPDEVFSPRVLPTGGGNSRAQPNMTSQTREQTKVVIAIDMSDHSDYAFDHYIKHLHRADNRIILVHSISSPHLEIQMPSSGSGAPLSFTETSPDYLRDLLQKKQDHISRVRQHFEQKIRALPVWQSVHYTFHFMNHTSNAGESLIDVITNVSPSFVVLGSRGPGANQRSFLSSVGHYVMNHTSTPVFLCHQGEKNLI